MKAVITKIENSVYGPHYKKFNLRLESGQLVFDVLLRDDQFCTDLMIKDEVTCTVYTNLYSSSIDSITKVA